MVVACNAGKEHICKEKNVTPIMEVVQNILRIYV
jgi:hypothetical protein